MGILDFFSFLLSPKKKAAEALKDPANFKAYVEKQSYSVSEQKELCKRFGLNYHEVSKEVRKSASVEKWAKSLTIVWTGNTDNIVFDYEDSDNNKTSRTIEVEELAFDEHKNFYIKGMCQLRNEVRHFNVAKISNISVGSKSFLFQTWAQDFLEVDVVSLLPKNTRTNFEIIKWEGDCPPTTFTYKDIDSRRRITVKPIRLYINKKGYLDLDVEHENGSTETLYVSRIDTMLSTDGYKKKHFQDWVKEVLELQNVS
ncbi:WYL domain-containing protein [Vibrio artabrorum]|uniref:WYL domain-containing protein n=1 Tax=Vibrio artabrorum TaxID=446374 RepID=UPI00354D6EF4